VRVPTLHSHPLSTFAQRVRIALHEKGVDWEVDDLDFQAREHKGETHLARHPYGKVPALTVADVAIFESTAILEYLEETHPQPPLMPATVEGRGCARSWMKACDVYFANHVGTIVFPMRFLPENRWRKDEIEDARRRIARYLVALESQLTGDWLVGDELTLADVCHAPFFQFPRHLQVEHPPKVAAWVERLLARPSVAATRVADANC